MAWGDKRRAGAMANLEKARAARRAKLDAAKAGKSDPAAAGAPGDGQASKPAGDDTPRLRGPAVVTTRAALAKQLGAARLAAAMFMGLPMMQLTPEEATLEVEAFANALAVWGFDIEIVGGRIVTTIGAILTILGIELPKVLAVAQLRAAQRAAQEAARRAVQAGGAAPGGNGPAPGEDPAMHLATVHDAPPLAA